jgi:hypothetical protein
LKKWGLRVQGRTEEAVARESPGVNGLRFRVQGSGYGVQGAGCRVWGAGFGV